MEYVHGQMYIDEIILQDDQTTVYYFAHDRRYSTTALMNTSGSVVVEGLAKKVAVELSPVIAAQVAKSALLQNVLKKVGVSAGTASTGIGIPIALTLMQGTLDRAAVSSRALKKENPVLWAMLKGKNLDMGYFLVESALKPHLGALNRRKKSLKEFQDDMKKKYCAECEDKKDDGVKVEETKK